MNTSYIQLACNNPSHNIENVYPHMRRRNKEAYLLLLSSDCNDDARNGLLLIDPLPPLHAGEYTGCIILGQLVYL
jgi:hypothetical protein